MVKRELLERPADASCAKASAVGYFLQFENDEMTRIASV